MNAFASHIVFTPLIPLPWLIALGSVAALLCLWLLQKGARGAVWRTVALTLLVCALLGPGLVEEAREPVADTALVVIDDSASQTLGERPNLTAAMRARVEAFVASQPDLDVRMIEAGTTKGEGTRLAQAIREALQPIPPDQRAGVAILTDGQVKDGDALSAEEINAPVHLLLTGTPHEFDRRLEIRNAPAYGIVGEEVELTVQITDSEAGRAGNAALTLTGDTATQTRTAAPGEPVTFTLPVAHPGANIFEVSVPEIAGEVTARNNRVFVTVNGVRDRLQVLLVSGKANIGQRSWRNILKSDPAIDLVHFTILRTPDKLNTTPTYELSLIPFPVHELFYEKIDGFDLIIFENFEDRGLLPQHYFGNVARYVRDGGAVLHMAGRPYGERQGIARSPLQTLLPASPTGTIYEEAFTPQLSDQGMRHPVTSALTPWYANDTPQWGPWFRRIDARIEAPGAQVLMTGEDAQPLLVLARVDDGRAAQVLSDHLWLWGRGYDGGGPYDALVRRLIHWLMKEPDLEEEGIKAIIGPGFFAIERRSLMPFSGTVTVTRPSGETESVALTEDAYGVGRARVEANESGMYIISDGTYETTIAVGDRDVAEFAEVVATEAPLRPLGRATGGGVYWLGEALPDLRRVDAGRGMAGSRWLAFRDNEAYTVKGLTQGPLIPFYGWLVLLVGAAVLAWRTESR